MFCNNYEDTFACRRYSKDQLQEEIKDVNDQMKKEEESNGALQVSV
jgi:hypothetical protein